MTYDEALRLLGLNEKATEADIKLAYRELAQILHPDKYANNKRLSDRANEQLKLVNEAREVLLGGKGSSRKGARQGGARGSGSGASGRCTTDRASALRAQLAGILAAKTQLTAQINAELGRRRIGTYLIAGGLTCMILGQFIKFILPLAGTALIWGAIQYFNAQTNVKQLRQYLISLEKDRRKLEKELEKL